MRRRYQAKHKDPKSGVMSSEAAIRVVVSSFDNIAGIEKLCSDNGVHVKWNVYLDLDNDETHLLYYCKKNGEVFEQRLSTESTKMTKTTNSSSCEGIDSILFNSEFTISWSDSFRHEIIKEIGKYVYYPETIDALAS